MGGQARAPAGESRQNDDLRSRGLRGTEPGEVLPWWHVLGVDADAILDEAKQAYRLKIKLYHPDRVAGPATEAETSCGAPAAARERMMAEPGWRPWRRWETCVDARGVRFQCLQ
jgi:hypothetical protein